jgi:hypothetical protein
MRPWLLMGTAAGHTVLTELICSKAKGCWDRVTDGV